MSQKITYGMYAPPSMHATQPELYKTASAYELVQELPGIAEKDIDIRTENYTLLISASTQTKEYERAYKKSYRIPDDIDQAKISATYQDGILIVNLPIREEMRPKQIKINVN